MFKILILIFALAHHEFCYSAPPPAPPPIPIEIPSSERPPNDATTTIPQKVQLIAQPQLITVERFEELLKSAAEIFQPSGFQLMEIMSSIDSTGDEQTPTTQSSTTISGKSNRKDDNVIVPVPLQRMQPPSPQAYNFYLPMYDYADQKTVNDAKSQSLVNIVPPAVARSHRAQSPSYYTEIKPNKKSPKKFDNAAKQVNLKWLNIHEKSISPSSSTAITSPKPTTVAVVPQTVYITNDERNRINFDDSFFGVDMQVKVPDNDPHKENGPNKAADDDANGGDMLFNQGEQMEDDLIATAARQFAQYA